MADLFARLRTLGLELPPVPEPVAAYLPALRHGDLVFTSGQLPLSGGQVLYAGKVGRDISLEQGYEAARICALNGLAAACSVVPAEQLIRVVKVLGFVNSAPGFTQQPQVVNGASELLQELLGENGKHARSAVSCPELPRNAAVEIEFIFACG